MSNPVKVYAVRDAEGRFYYQGFGRSSANPNLWQRTVDWSSLHLAFFQINPLDCGPHMLKPGEEIVEVQLSVVRVVPGAEMRKMAGGR